jgi:hypothetical protein
VIVVSSWFKLYELVVTMRLQYLPIEILSIILGQLDTLSKIRARAVCRDFASAVYVSALANFTHSEHEELHVFESIDAYISHAYTSLLDTAVAPADKTYNLTRFPTVCIVFIRTRKHNRNKFSVNITSRNIVQLRISYDARNKRYTLYKFTSTPVVLPSLFYVVALRFMIKIHGQRFVEHNFASAQIPEIYRRMTRSEYKGSILPELLSENITLE